VAEGEGLGDGKSGRVLARTMAFKKRVKDGETVIGAWLSITDPSVVEVFGGAGFDFLIIDMEHGGEFGDLHPLKLALIALNGSPTVPMVRVPWNDQVRIKQVLDLGVEGVMAPMVSTVEECKALVSACLYPPRGRRGSGPRRASNYYRDAVEYMALANDAIFIMPQVENIATIDVIDEFLAVPGVDAVAIGPNDMSGTAGVFGDRHHPKITGAIEAICRAAKKRGLPVFDGLVTPVDEVADHIKRGMRIITIAGDMDLLVAATRDLLKTTRKAVGRGD
jgi:2-keto-3-deoxy-L-rhamnonate aldolase RhmA